MPVQTYNVPLILPSLRKEESINQIIDALEYLEQVSSDIFSRISARVAENRERLASLNQRSDLAQARIDKIKGIKKATRVFSSAKYPASKELEPYKSLYSSETELAEIKRRSYELNSKFTTVDDKLLKEKLQFYNVHLNVHKKEDEGKGEGLGSLPRNLHSVSSLLLFNSTENPYKKYVMLDPLAGAVTKTRSNIEEEENMADAPISITRGEELDRLTTANYFYVPNLGEVPEIDVPVYLPDLPGVADDVSYSADLGPSIAPSLPGSNMPDLPDVLESEPSAAPPPPDAGVPPPPPSAGVPPPPPPPPPPPGPAAPPPPPPPPGPAAPPPPPPPPPPPSEGTPTAVPDDIPTEVVASDSRNELMNAIRATGGSGKIKLRNAKERKLKKKAKKESSVEASGGGDLMGDLFAKLSMRRKGISGSKGETSSSSADHSSSGSAMDKISAMIPAPPKVDRADSMMSAESDDWEA